MLFIIIIIKKKRKKRTNVDDADNVRYISKNRF